MRFVLFACILLPLAASGAEGPLFTGGANPATQGWIEDLGKGGSAAARLEGSAWRIEDDDDAGPEWRFYHTDIEPQLQDLARREGFHYRWRLRIAQDTGKPTRAISTEVCVARADGTGRLRFFVQMGRAGADLLASFQSGTHGYVTGSVTVEDPGDFHEWELIFDGKTNAVNLKVDRELLLQVRCDHDAKGPPLVFGSRARGSGISDWDRVEFQAGPPNPEEFSQPSPPPFLQEVYVAGQNDYFAFRAPALLVTQKGTLLAFAHGRKDSIEDLGNQDMVLKRSRDLGQTWSPMQILLDSGDSAISTPVPVLDETSGRIVAVFARNANRIFTLHSDDDGQTWSEPVEITDQVKAPDWNFIAVGPGIGVQMREPGPHQGRIVIPAYYRFTEDKRGTPYAFVMFSDDRGQTWQRGGPASPETNECQVAELPGGGLLLNARNHWARTGGKPELDGRRIVVRGTDGGLTWGEPVLDPTLIEPTCQASLLRYSWPGPDSKSRLLFANPAETPHNRNGGTRHRLTVRMSYDEGLTWPVSRLIDPAESAYSSLARLPDGRIGLMYESGAYKQITFAVFDLKWLGEG